MTMQVTIRFHASRGAVDRALGSVLLQKEADTARHLIGGFYFDTERNPQEVFDAFHADGSVNEDFRSIEFSFAK